MCMANLTVTALAIHAKTTHLPGTQGRLAIGGVVHTWRATFLFSLVSVASVGTAALRSTSRVYRVGMMC